MDFSRLEKSIMDVIKEGRQSLATERKRYGFIIRSVP